MWATKTLYLVPNSNWTQANAKLAVYYYNNSAGTDGWSSLMTAVAGETNVFSTTIPDGFTSIIFVRLDSKATTGNWNDKWNQSADLTLPDGKDLFVMADGWDAVSGTWQTYSAGTPIVVPTKSVPSEAPDVMLQAFYWDSYQDHGYGNNRWSTMLSQAEEIGSYFDLVWFPPCSQSSGGTGYIPKQYSNLNSDWGSESDLRALISALHNKGTRAVADIVVNHITGNYGWCSFASMNFGEYGTFNPDASWICQTDEMNSESSAGDCRGKATGANDDGYGGEANYTAARDWDHTNPQVQAMCRAYLQWLKNDVGFDGWRYDYGKGFHHSHINDYNTAAGAYFSVVEYWDGNPDVIRQRLEDASWNNMAFDFGTKYDALNNGICSYNYAKCQGAGMLGAGLAKHAVTFVDNHDTFTRNDSEFGGQNNSMSTSLKDRLLQANAYILSMPGIPCVFYPHWVTYKSEIKAMIEARHLTGVHSESQVKDESASATGYQATIVGKNGYIVLQLGDKASGTINGFTKKASGNGYAIWIYTNNAVPVDPNAPKFYITGDSALVVDAGLDKSKAWSPDAIKSEKDTLELTLKADTYYTLKLTTDGTWNTAKGYNDLSEKAAGLEDNGNDHNIGFKLKAAGKVQVIYFVKDNKTTFQLSGNFVTKADPVDPEQPTDSTTVYFVNTLNWTTVNTFVWPAEGNAYKAWPGEAAAKEAEPLQGYDVYAYTFPAKYVNVIFNNGDTQTVDLTWSAAKPYFVPSEKNAGDKMQGTWYAKADVPAAPEPVVPAKFYITGDSALVVDAGLDKSKAWSPDAIKSEKDTLELTLKADTYYTLKLTTDGTWNTAKGYNDLSEKAAGLEDNGNDHNIGFKLKDAGKVQVIYFVKDNKTTFQLSGNFVTKVDPVDPEQPTDSTTVYFVNTLNWTTVNTYVWPAEGEAYKAWPGEAAAKEAEPLQGYDVYAYTFPAKYVNVIFNNGNTQTVDLTWSAAKPYFVPTDKTAEGKMQGTWYAKADVPAAPEPVVPAKFYITGDSALVVDAGLDKSKAWSPDAIKSEKDTLELTLKADTYYTLKLTTDGTWNTAKGYNDLSEKAAGLEDNGNDHNIGFKLKAAGKVQVIYFVKDNKTTFQLSGNFVTKADPIPTVADGFYLMGTMNGWKADENYLFVPNETTEGEYMLSVTLTEGDELKVAKVMNGVAMTWYPAEGANFVVSATHAGKKVIYFREQYNADWADFGGYIYIANDIAEGIHDTTAEQPAVKVIINNCLLIRRGTRTYTVAGELVR